MHNQLEQFKSSLEKISAPFGEYHYFYLTNENYENTILQDFKENYKGLSNFALRAAEKSDKLMEKTNRWLILLDNNLKLVYINNDSFVKFYKNKRISIVDPEDYLLDESQMKTKPLESLQEFNLLEGVLHKLEEHKKTLKGKEYYFVKHKMWNTLLKEIAEFYCKTPESNAKFIEDNKKLFPNQSCLMAINYEFDFTLVINAQTLKIEKVFNDFFMNYNNIKKDLSVVDWTQSTNKLLSMIDSSYKNSSVNDYPSHNDMLNL